MEGDAARQLIVVSDADVVIHFLSAGRADLLQRYEAAIVVTEEVRQEVSRRSVEDAALFEDGLRRGAYQEIVVSQIDEVELFLELSRDAALGAGECSAIAAAVCRGHGLAMDDVAATKRARRRFPELTILKTQDIVVSLILSRHLTVQDADVLLREWATQHRFAIPIASFEELLP